MLEILDAHAVEIRPVINLEFPLCVAQIHAQEVTLCVAQSQVES